MLPSCGTPIVCTSWTSKDNAKMHLSAILDSEVQNERLLAFAEPFNFNALLAVMLKIDPGRTFPEALPRIHGDVSEVDNGRFVELLKRVGQGGWSTIKDSIRQGVQAPVTSSTHTLPSNLLKTASVQ